MPGKLFPLGGPVSEEDKTSLAHEVLRRLKRKGFYTASVDFFRLTGKRDSNSSGILVTEG